jgi:hypothetical protein
MYFVSDGLIAGRANRFLAVVDDATRENVELVARHTFTGSNLAEALAMQLGA